ncbi:flagellar hook-associated protein 1 FlgK [Epibacterium ulvae]|uniref:Flagellar hook-associated protein 1 n=1 Tax=Epibacterium ulvae TaxID=1156985 RepID=A0A1G5RJ35_9RHOB|nr:flagellar hook-associated protein FlgK [Epibacterium ulvae]SCZ74064.1 flagellar hook-associated protein 1 FlgK [Epibacterium ulvae]
MTLSSAINSARSGIFATSRSIAVVSDNLANALTPGYSRRSVELSTRVHGVPGVHVTGITRANDPGILENRRTVEAEHKAAESRESFYKGISDSVGTVDDPSSLASFQSNFDAALIEASSRPDSVQRLNALSAAAGEYVEAINRAANEIANQRNAAERSIEQQVEAVNASLKEIEKLNARIVLAEAAGNETVALMDQRDQAIDRVNTIVPVKVVPRQNGQVALFSHGGSILLDGRANELTFNGKRDLTPYMTQASGALSGIEISGLSIRTGQNGAMKGGTLAEAFEIRDVYSVDAQAELDMVARDLIERFQDPTLDTTLGATDAGLFTDEGAFFDPANELGIANRLSLNDVVAIDGAGETWRLRDGLNAAAPGNAGDATLLRGYSEALDESRSVVVPTLGAVNVTAATLAADVMSRFAHAHENSRISLSFTAASFTEAHEMELAEGVDTDAELQSLLAIEKAYAANARVLSVVDELMETILRI